ncbi:caspase, EACC1-associated type [Peterkaempfera bronchialis]|uniref:caspase, EACC1-associated type n=1 Tax=Peterkaempfera bronchialis TaxID=2126346 RepID=UPI003C2B3863
MPGYLPSPADSRALLIGAGLYPAKGFPELPQAGENLAELRSVLSDGEHALLLPHRVTTLRDPDLPGEVFAAVHRAAAETTELLLVYYVGHGYVDADGELFLAVGGSAKETAHFSAVRCSDLLEQLADADVERFVLILDCCYSGNLLDGALPTRRPFAVLTSSPHNREVSPGQGRLTPFTEQLAQVLRHGVSTPHGHATVQAVGRELEARARLHQPPDTVYHWAPTEVSHQAGDTMLSLALGPSGDLERALGTLRGLHRRATGYLAAGWQWFFGRGRPRWRRLLGIALSLALLAAGGATGYALTRPGTCPPPLELRMLTAPEEVGPLSGIADSYERSPANHQDIRDARDCRTTHLTVYGAGLDAIAQAFSDPAAWNTPGSDAFTQVGPQPDLWIPQSSAERLYVVQRVPGSYDGLLGTGISVAGSRPVLAVSDSVRAALRLGPSGTTVKWSTLRDRWLGLKDPPVLLRPNPTVSGTGLVHTLGLYRDPDGDAGALALEDSEPLIPDGEIGRLERQVIGQGRSAQDGYWALCELRRGYERDRAYGSAAALVSQRELDAMEAGDPLGDQCPDAVDSVRQDPGRRLDRYWLRGVPDLDYPLVPVVWPGAADTEQRQAAVRRFRDWLTGPAGSARIAQAGYGGSGDGPPDQLSAGGVDTRLARYSRAHPNLRLLVLFDVSGSMGEEGRMEEARRSVEAALRRLADSDVYGLTTFPTGHDPAAAHEVVPLGAAVPDAFTLPAPPLAGTREADLYTVLGHALDRLDAFDHDGRQSAVLLVTDGDWLIGATEEERASARKKLTQRLAATGVPLIVASMRPYGCAREAAALAGASVGGTCVASDSMATRLPQLVAALTKRRVTP